MLCGIRSRTPSSSETLAGYLTPDECDWEFVIQTARRHGVAAILCRNLKTTSAHRVPEPVMVRLLKIFKENAGNALSFIGRLLVLLRQFQENGITAVPFKGPVLSQRVYGDPILRSFIDIDILVSPSDTSKAVFILAAAGYTPNVKLNAGQFARYLQTEYSMEADSNDRRTIVELHWELTGRYTSPPFLLETFANRCECIDLMGKTVHGMPAEEILVYLCIHGSKDGWTRLESILSLAELIDSNPGLNWDRIFHLSEKLQCARMLRTGLFLAYDLFNPSMPEAIAGRAEVDLKVRKIAENIYLHFFTETAGGAGGFITSDFSKFHFIVREKTSEKIAYLVRLLFLPSRQEWRYFPVPAVWHFLLYVLRPLRLLHAVGHRRFFSHNRGV